MATLNVFGADATNGKLRLYQAGDTIAGAGSGGSTDPGGSSGELQYNNSNTFAGVTGSAITSTNFDIGSRNLTVASGSISASAPVLDLSQTWAGAGVTYTGINLSITNTSGTALSKLADFKVGGSSVFAVDAQGNSIFGFGGPATNTQKGFIYLPTMTDTPSGTPLNTYSGYAPIALEADTTNSQYRLFAFINSAWRDLSGAGAASAPVNGEYIVFNSSGSLSAERVIGVATNGGLLEEFDSSTYTLAIDPAQTGFNPTWLGTAGHKFNPSTTPSPAITFNVSALTGGSPATRDSHHLVFKSTARESSISRDTVFRVFNNSVSADGSAAILKVQVQQDIVGASYSDVFAVRSDGILSVGKLNELAQLPAMATARLLGRSSSSTGNVEEISIGSGLSLSSGVLAATGGGGSTTPGGSPGDLQYNSGGVAFAGAIISQAALNIIEQRATTNAQTFRVANTYDGTNNEWLQLSWAGNVALLETVKTGSATARPIAIKSAGAYLTLEQAGDTSGTSRITLHNNSSTSQGMTLTNVGIDAVQLKMIGSAGTNPFSLWYENRSGSKLFAVGELQLGTVGTPTLIVAPGNRVAVKDVALNLAPISSTPVTATDGDVWSNSTHTSLTTRQSGQEITIGGKIWSSAQVVTYNSGTAGTTETTLLAASGFGSKNIAANIMKNNKVAKVKLFGVWSTPSSPPQMTVYFKVGGTSVAQAVFTPAANLSGEYFEIEAVLSMINDGTGAVVAMGKFNRFLADTTIKTHVLEDQAASITPSVSNSVVVSVKAGTSVGGVLVFNMYSEITVA
jgi:hypothetical protein